MNVVHHGRYVVLGVVSPFFSAIVRFEGFLERRMPGKNGGGTPRVVYKSAPPPRLLRVLLTAAGEKPKPAASGARTRQWQGPTGSPVPSPGCGRFLSSQKKKRTSAWVGV